MGECFSSTANDDSRVDKIDISEFEKLMVAGISKPTPSDDVEEIDVSNLTTEQMAALSDEEIIAIEMGKKKFFRRIAAVDSNRDYTIIVDKSASMINKHRPGDESANCWREAQLAVSYLAPRVCQCDPDGITLYFFSSEDTKNNKPPFNKFCNIKTTDDVMRLFDLPENQPKFGTDMTSVLRDSIWNNVNSPRKKPETILLITDGAPDNKKAVKNLIIEATKSIKSDKDLSISIIQVGDDKNAASWLKSLDDDLQSSGGAKFDIVDVMSCDEMKQLDFAEIVRRSLVN